MGISLNLKFFDEDFYKPIDKKFETPEEQKYCYDNASLKSVIGPLLETLVNTSNFKFKCFLGDSEFDSYDNFGFLQQCGFEKVFIPLNPRNQGNSKIGDLEYDIEGVPLCPLDKTPFKAEGPCKGKNRSLRFKFTCPKSRRDKKSGRMTYVYPDKDFRLYSGVQRNSNEWDDEYTNRACIERTLSSLKYNPNLQEL